MSWDYSDGLGFIFDEPECNDDEEYSEFKCPECGSTNVKIRKHYENSDRDNNRGIMLESLTCRDCGYDEW